jgi:hypothetical protein
MARNYSRVGAWVNAQRGDQANALGGYVIKLQSAANILTVGMGVKLDSNAQLVACTVQTDGPACIGVVVGGKLTDGIALWRSADVGTAVCAATAGQDVIVAVAGSIVWVKKLAGSGLTMGATITPAAAGAFTAGASLLFSQTVGTPMATAASGDVVALALLSKR